MGYFFRGEKERKDPSLREPWSQAAGRTVWPLPAENDGGRLGSQFGAGLGWGGITLSSGHTDFEMDATTT